MSAVTQVALDNRRLGGSDVRNRKIRILHEGHEFFLVDRGRSAARRVITFLKRIENGDEAREAGEGGEASAGGLLVKTDIGDCMAIASWSGGKVSVERGHESLETVFRDVVERYLEEFRLGRPARNSRPYYFLSSRNQPLFELSRAQPSGLAVLVYSSEETAMDAARLRRNSEGDPVQIEAVGELSDFLAARSVEGFAGALMDDRDPVFFFSNESGDPRFLRLSIDSRSGGLRHSLLEEDGSWNRYEGEEELNPELDQDVVDEHMIERLGDVPFLGYRIGVPLYRLAVPDAPELPALAEPLDEPDESAEPVESGQSFCPVFHDMELAAEFLQEHDLDQLEAVVVEDLRELAAYCAQEGRTLVLQPAGHRARGGTFWLNGNRVILDSFSGLWCSEDGVHFDRE